MISKWAIETEIKDKKGKLSWVVEDEWPESMGEHWARAVAAERAAFHGRRYRVKFRPGK
jgi:hypothetical protein